MAPRAGLDHKIVVQAATALADAKGLHEVTLTLLASRLGVRTPTLYHYVADGLSGLRRELALAGLRELATQLGKAVMGKAGDDAVMALALAHLTFAREHPGLYTATAQAADPSDKEWREAGWEVVEIALSALAAYQLPHDEAIHAIRILRCLIHGFVELEAAGGFKLPQDVDETFQRLLDMFLRHLHYQQAIGK
jgi:AcrR family transcriptional regulator